MIFPTLVLHKKDALIAASISACAPWRYALCVVLTELLVAVSMSPLSWFLFNKPMPTTILYLEGSAVYFAVYMISLFILNWITQIAVVKLLSKSMVTHLNSERKILSVLPGLWAASWIYVVTGLLFMFLNVVFACAGLNIEKYVYLSLSLIQVVFYVRAVTIYYNFKSQKTIWIHLVCVPLVILAIMLIIGVIAVFVMGREPVALQHVF